MLLLENRYVYRWLFTRKQVNEIKVLQERFGRVAMIGDGINDAPALETAGIVLMKNNLPKITHAIHLE